MLQRKRIRNGKEAKRGAYEGKRRADRRGMDEGKNRADRRAVNEGKRRADRRGAREELQRIEGRGLGKKREVRCGMDGRKGGGRGIDKEGMWGK
jgi:hypothetical protein